MNKRDAASLSIAEAATPAASNAPQNGGGGGGDGLLPDVLLDATGARCELFEHLGFSHGVVLKSARALCIVMHLKNERSSEEMKLRESTWSAQYHQADFSDLAGQGVTLENIVYYRSTGNYAPQATHYFVMTTDIDALLSFRAIKSAQPANGKPPCDRSNIDNKRLEAYARLAVSKFVPQLSKQALVQGGAGLSLFDFSERLQSNRAAALAPCASFALAARGRAAAAKRRGGGPSGSMSGNSLLVTRVGDSLQEPFWPEGLGINRGFLHVLDCADMVQGYSVLLRRRANNAAENSKGGGSGNNWFGLGGGGGGQSDEAAMEEEYHYHMERLLARREALFGYTKRVSGHNRLTELKPHAISESGIGTNRASTTAGPGGKFTYTIDPASRYAGLPIDLPPRPEMELEEMVEAGMIEQAEVEDNFRI